MFSIRPIVYIIGFILAGLGVFMFIPAIVDWSIDNPDWRAFTLCALGTLFVAGLMIASSHGGNMIIDVRQGFLLTTATWVLIAAFGALPFMAADPHLSFTDAYFETMSGLTTTGSTVIVGLDNLPAGVLLWRSLLHFIGGVGIIVLAVAMLPFLRVGGMQLFRTESSDKSDKALPRAAEFAGGIVLVYTGLTALCAFLYWLFGMTGFEAINHAFATLATGGFSTSDSSFGHFPQPALHWTGTLFMAVGGLPMSLFLRAVRGDWRGLYTDSQVRAFVLLLVAFSLLLAGWLVVVNGTPILDALRLASFNVTSVVTTTGFATADYLLWGTLPIMTLFLLTFVGGCSGSTAGAIKIFRLEVLGLVIQRHLRKLPRPHSVFIPAYQARPLDDDIMTSVGNFVFLYAMTTVALTLALAATGLDFATSFSGSATALGNVGPGTGAIIGPAGNFSTLPDAAKWLLSLGMMLGRLELYTVYVLLTVRFWRT